MRLRRVDRPPTAVRLDGASLDARADEAALLAAGSGFFWDDRDLALVALFPDHPGFSLEVDVDTSLVALAPPVPMTFRVHVPPGTPKDPPVHIATDASGWQHVPLPWSATPDVAEGTVSLPRGAYVFYKYTRGSWATVEKWPGCAEATNRYELGAAHPVKEDTVFAWADQCQ